MLCGWQHFTETQRAQIATGIAENRVLGGPYMLEVHPTNQCTVKCFFCYCEECRHGESLSWETLEGQLREGASHDVRFLRLSGGGESLLYPKINELLDLCGELDLRIVDLTTNATRLEPVAEKIVQVGLDFAMISLNEAEPDRYGRMMQVTPKTFEKAIRGVEALVRARPLEHPRSGEDPRLPGDAPLRGRCGRGKRSVADDERRFLDLRMGARERRRIGGEPPAEQHREPDQPGHEGHRERSPDGEQQPGPDAQPPCAPAHRSE
jgi:hypothetical protein